jgi:hypothetical protein
MNISPHPAWLSAMPGSNWVSNGDTGDPRDPSYVVYPNGTVVRFSQQFFLDGPANSATLSVLADDTTSVVLNGHMVAAQTTVPGLECASQPIGCKPNTRGDYGSATLMPFLQAGNNTIQFDVLQHDLVSFGLDYSGSITTAPVGIPMPEPGTMWLVAGAGAFVCITRLKRLHRTDSTHTG